MAYIRHSVTRPAGDPGKGYAVHDELVLLPVEDIIQFPERDADGVTLSGNIVMCTVDPIRLYITPGTVEIADNSEGDTDAVGFATSVKGSHPGNSAEVREFKEKCKGRGFVVLLYHCDGSPADIVGTPCNPCIMTPTYTANKDTNRSEFAFAPTFKGNGVAVYTGETPSQAPSIYGIEYDISNPTEVKRIGNMELHKTLPVQSQIRGVLLSPTGTENKVLPEGSWLAETRDGTGGSVMVKLPEHFVRFETSGSRRRVLLSSEDVPGFRRVPMRYVSAYEAAIDRSANALYSLANTGANYRGGNNNTNYDDKPQSLLGLPVTHTDLQSLRAAARKGRDSKWNVLTYDIAKEIFWLFATEYATLDAKKAVSATKTAEGYMQGGLGAGATTLAKTTEELKNHNGLNPLLPCGVSDKLGGGSGEMTYTPSGASNFGAGMKVARYRGIEHPFGHIKKRVDGVAVRSGVVYVTNNPDHFEAIDEHWIAVAAITNGVGQIDDIAFGEEGDFVAKSFRQGAAGFGAAFCAKDISTSAEGALMTIGGGMLDGTNAGLICQEWCAPPNGQADAGTRLTYLPFG